MPHWSSAETERWFSQDEKFPPGTRVGCFACKVGFPPLTRKHPTLFYLVIQRQELDRVGFIRFLGVTLGRSLAWKQHIDNLEQKDVNVLRSFSSIACGASTQSLLLLHRAVVRQGIPCSLPPVYELSASLEKWMSYVLARSSRVTLGVPRFISSLLAIT